ncbi:MAG: PAS domain-containing protein [Acidobacteriota bacterium]
MSGGITVADARQPDLPLVYANGAFSRMTGYAVEDCLGRNCRFLQGSDRDQEGLTAMREAIRERRDVQVVLRNFRADGRLFWNELKIMPVFDEAGELTHYIGLQTDITSRVRAEDLSHLNGRLERQLRAERRSTTTMATVTDRLEPVETILGEVRFGAVLADPEGVVSYMNRTACDLLRTSLEDARGRLFLDLFSGGKELRAVFPLGVDAKERRLDSSLVLADGSLLNAGFTLQRAQGAPAETPYQLLLFRELGELQQVEQEMRELKRLSSLGQMAAGFAHQVRNPLAAIRSLAEGLLPTFPAGDNRREYCERTVALVQRVETLVRRSLRFTHEEGPKRIPTAPSALIDEALEVLDPRLQECGGPVMVQLSRGLPPVLVDAAQIVEILIILVENALDATGTSLRIRLVVEAVGEVEALGGSFVAVDVVDRGHGIEARKLERIFDPFYTTKPRGSGLGLSIALRIAHENRARLQVRSQVGRGTTFRLLMPVATP